MIFIVDEDMLLAETKSMSENLMLLNYGQKIN